MAVMLRKQRDGMPRPNWYGEYKDANGKRKVFNTGIKWTGTPPASGSLREPGDDAFERSRDKAESVLENHRDEAKRKGNAAHLVERLIEAKTGRAVEHVKLADLGARWLSRLRLKTITKQHAKTTSAAFERFAVFMARQNTSAVFLYDVSQADAEAYVKELFETLAPRTARGHVALVRSAFKRFLPVGAANPFEGVGGRDTDEGGTIHRRPFTADELRALIDCAGEDEMMRDLITAAACTGLRRGDLCRLAWAAVDLPARMLTVKTSKSGAEVEIPLFVPMLAVLESRKGNGSPLVFPEAAAMLASNPCGLSYRFKQIAARALDTATPEALPEVTDAAEIETEGANAIRANVTEGPRRERMLSAFLRYCQGDTFRQIEKETRIPRGVISADLRAVEGWIGKRFVRSVRGGDMKEAVARVTRTTRAQGGRSGSVYDWHALRTTFVTLALSAGVPMELVRRVTGHKTVEIVLAHYFRPGRDEFRAAFAGALPDVLTGAKAAAKALPPADEMAAILSRIQDGTATKKDKARLQKLAAMV